MAHPFEDSPSYPFSRDGALDVAYDEAFRREIEQILHSETSVDDDSIMEMLAEPNRCLEEGGANRLSENFSENTIGQDLHFVPSILDQEARGEHPSRYSLLAEEGSRVDHFLDSLMEQKNENEDGSQPLDSDSLQMHLAPSFHEAFHSDAISFCPETRPATEERSLCEILIARGAIQPSSGHEPEGADPAEGIASHFARGSKEEDHYSEDSDGSVLSTDSSSSSDATRRDTEPLHPGPPPLGQTPPGRRGLHVRDNPDLQRIAREGAAHWALQLRAVRAAWAARAAHTPAFLAWFSGQAAAAQGQIKSKQECLLRSLQMAAADGVIAAGPLVEGGGFFGWTRFAVVRDRAAEFRAGIEALFPAGYKKAAVKEMFRRAGLVPEGLRWEEGWRGDVAFVFRPPAPARD